MKVLSSDRKKISDLESENGKNDEEKTNIDIKTPEIKEEKHKKSFIKSKLGKIIIITSISLIFVVLIIVISLFLDKKDKKETKNEIIENSNNSNINIVELSLKIDSTKIYQETQIINSTLTYSKSEIEESNYRRLTRKNIDQEIIITKYLINIYDKKDLNDNLNTSILSAYALILSSEGKNKRIESAFPENEEEDEKNEVNYYGGYNIYNKTNNNNLIPINSGDIPLIKFNFFQNGSIQNIFYPENINITFLKEIKNVISKVIPEVSSSLFSNSNKLNLRQNQQEEKIREYDKENNIIKIEENESDNEFTGSSSLSSSEINIDDKGNINSVSVISKSNFNGNENLQIDDIQVLNDSLLQPDDIKGDVDNVRRGMIENFEVESQSNISLIENEIDENIKNKFKDLEKEFNLNFIQYENEENQLLRSLGLTKEKGINYDKYLKDNNFIEYENINLRNLKMDSFYQPIQFSYSIFKNNFLGILFGMNAFVSFIPNSGEFNSTLVYRINNNAYEILSRSEKINFIEIADTINNIKDKTMVAIALTEINLNQDFESYKKQIGEQLNIIKSQLEDVYDISNLYTPQLINLTETIKNASINTYNKVKENIKNADDDIANLKVRINNGIETNSSKIISDSSNNLFNLITNQKNIMDNIYNNMCNLTNSIIQRVASVHSFIFDIDSYYSYNETINTAISIMENLCNEISTSVLAEEELFKNYTLDTEFKNQLEINLQENEKIAQRLLTNQTLIDSIPENQRNNMINSLNSYRNQILEILNIILNKISNEYNNKISDLSNLKDYLNPKINDLRERQSNMLQALRRFIKLDEKLEVYTHELAVLINLEDKLNSERRRSFLENYVKKINRKENTYLTNSDLTNIENDIDNIVKEIIQILNSGDLTNLKNATQKYIQKINNVLTDIIGNNLVFETIVRYNNTEELKEMTNKYYESITKIMNEYSNDFYEEFRKNIEDEKFISEPKEIALKLNQTKTQQEKVKAELIEQLTEILQFNIKKDLLTSYEKVFNIIEKEHNKIFMEVPIDKYSDISEITQIEEVYETTKIIINEKKSANIFSQQTNDPFNIQYYISDKEKEIINVFSTVNSEIMTDFKYQYCKDEIYELCIKDLYLEQIDTITEYNYQMAKIRNAINQVKDLVSLSKKVITNENSLTNLNSNEVFEKYVINSNFKSDLIVSLVLNYLNEMNYNEINLISPQINSIKEDTKMTFENNINKGLLFGKISQIAKDIFVPYYDLDYKTIDFYYSSIKELGYYFKKELTYFANKQNYYLEQISFENSYSTFRNELLDLMNNKANESLNNLTVHENIINDTYNKISNLIDESYQSINKIISETSKDFSKFELFNHSFTIENICLGAMEEEIKEIKTFIYKNITDVFNEYLINFKNEYLSRINNKNTEIIGEIDMYYSTILLTLTKNTQLNDDNKEIISSMREETFNKITNSVMLFYSNISNYYTAEKFEYLSLSNKRNALNQFKLNYSFDEFKMKITENAKILKNNTEKMYQKEQLEFIEKIESLIETGFNETITNFYYNQLLPYVNKTVLEDLEYALQPELNYFIQVIDNNDNFLHSIIEQNETKTISTLMKNRLTKLYSELKLNITRNIKPRIESIIYIKIDKFRREIEEKITEKFSQIISAEIKSDNFKKKISERIYVLIPNQLREPFKKRLISVFQEISGLKATNQMKEIYKNKIEAYLELLESVLDNYDTIINQTIASLPTSKSDNILIILTSLHEKYSKIVREYNPIISYEIDENKIINIQNIENYLNDKMLNIKNAYEYQKNVSDNSIEEIIPNFKLYSDSIETNLNSENKIEKSGRAQVNLKKILEKITVKFEEYFNNFEQSVGNREELIKIQRSNNRLLKEFSIEEIESEIDLIEDNYNTFSNDVLKIEEFIQLNLEYEKFTRILRNSLEKNDEYFSYAFESVKDYISEEQFNNFTLALKEDSEKCKNIVLNYLNKHSDVVLNSIELIEQGIKQLFTSDLRNKINNKVDETLKDLYEGVLSQIENINKPYSGVVNSQNLPQIVIQTFLRYKKVTFNSKPAQINYSSNFLFTRDGMSLIIENNVGSVVNNNANGVITGVSSYYKATMNGQIGNGEIGFKSIYDLKDNKVKLDAYQNQKDASYSNYLYYRNRLDRSETIILQRTNSKHIIKNF